MLNTYEIQSREFLNKGPVINYWVCVCVGGEGSEVFTLPKKRRGGWGGEGSEKVLAMLMGVGDTTSFRVVSTHV